MRFILSLLILQTLFATSSLDGLNSHTKVSQLDNVKLFFAHSQVDKKTYHKESSSDNTTTWAFFHSSCSNNQKQLIRNSYFDIIKETRNFLFTLRPRSPPLS
jgi:hypothetical protein